MSDYTSYGEEGGTILEMFRFAFEQLSPDKIAEQVRDQGVDAVVRDCAIGAGTLGAIGGLGGVFTSVLAIPVDLAAMTLLQMRTTMAVTYHEKGTCAVTFPELMSIMARSLGVEAGVIAGKVVAVNVAAAMLAGIAARSAGKWIPIIGAVIGGAGNAAYIYWIAASVRTVHRNGGSGTLVIPPQ